MYKVTMTIEELRAETVAVLWEINEPAAANSVLHAPLHKAHRAPVDVSIRRHSGKYQIAADFILCCIFWSEAPGLEQAYKLLKEMAK